ncbi:hypothetical protein V8C34DRAFT_319846 [Trichoderma compactum]
MESTLTVTDLLERNKIVAKNYKPSPYHTEPNYGKNPSLISKDPLWLLEVVVHRNAGGSVQHALRDIIILGEVMGLKEIALVHHTDCGTLRFRDEDVRKSLKAKTDPKHWPELDAMYLGAITNVEQSVWDDLEWLGTTPFVRKDLVGRTRGFIFDVKSGAVSQISSSG